MKFLTLLTMLMGLFSQSTFAQSLEIKDAKVRAPIPGMSKTSGYMTLVNNSNKDVSLVAAKSDIANKVEIHDHIMNNGVMKMVKLDGLMIKANETKTFESGGLHLMFIGLKNAKEVKDKVTVTFMFKDGTEQVSTFNVKSIHQHHH